MRRLLKRALNSVKKRAAAQRKRLPAPISRTTGRDVGYHDEMRNGWFSHATGELLTGFPICPGDVVLDVGCGEGGMSNFAASQGAEVIATDVDAGCVERTGKILERSKARASRALVSDTNPLPLESGTVSRVISLEVLEHVPDPAAFMAELVRVARPGALFLLAVPDDKAETIQKRIAPPAYWAPPNHVRVFTRPEFARLITDAGLIIEKHTTKSFFWAMWWILFWAADQDWKDPESPLLQHWTEIWRLLSATPKGDHVRAALDEFMPKSQVIIARKPGP